MKLVLVESPTKAKTINKYLGKDYQVLASYGHVRDLPAKDGSVDPEHAFDMVWQIDPKAEKNLKEIIQAVKKSDGLLLATDPDREGEAISWHVLEILKQRAALKGIEAKRVVFNQVTKSAIQHAIDNPRDLDQDLIEAYLARRALDYLVGFTISPLLWRKLPGTRSAGRVQSVALRLISDREYEIEQFITDEYWTILADFLGNEKRQLQARLTHLGEKKLAKLTIGDEKSAKQAVKEIEKHKYKVADVAKKQVKRNPTPPFTTSTLQQEAARKLGFSAKRTMRLAQQLYEGISINGETTGLITYMRTDSVQVAPEALDSNRNFIKKQYGDRYVPEKPRFYKSKAKNAQEAHEAIRPTDVSKHPKDIAKFLDPAQAKLYELVWKRMVASQMASAVLNQVAIDVADGNKQVIFRATGSTIEFDGFFRVYRESKDDGDDEKENILPVFEVGEALEIKKVMPEQHFTQPPPRYSEASLVKKLEELGIGRPSTYANIIHTLIDRNYVLIDKKQFHPTARGRILTAFLIRFFEKYVQFSFTADLEEQLDDISGGRRKWKDVLAAFWKDFHKAVDDAKDLTITQVLDQLNKDLAYMLFPVQEEGKDPRQCPKCKKGQLSLKVGKFGAFVGCSDYPDCKFTRQLTTGQDDSEQSAAIGGEPKVLGIDSESKLEVTLRKGPYGFYIQWGEADKKAKIKPKRASVPKDQNVEEITLETALKIGSLPRIVGTHPKTDKEITAGIGRFGPYLRHDGRYHSLKEDDVLTVGLDRAVEVISQAKPQKAPTDNKKKKRTK